MLNAIFYLIVILCVFAGYKKGAVAAGHFYIAIGMGVYFSVWLLPFVLPAVDMVPESYREYALPLFLLLCFIAISVLVKYGINKLIEEYPAYSSVPVIAGMPVVNNAVGAVFGAYLGYALAAFLLFVLSLAPYSVAGFIGDELGERADAGILEFSGKVNRFSNSSWNTRQAEFLKKLAKKHRKKPVADVGEVDIRESDHTTPAENAPEDGNTAPVEGTAVQRLAGKAVQAAAENQARAMELMDGAAMQKAVKKTEGQVEREAVMFTLTLPVLQGDGRDSGWKREVKLGIVLPEDGKTPELIDASVPHPVFKEPKRRIYRTVRLDLSQIELTRVDALPEGTEIKYSVIDVE